MAVLDTNILIDLMRKRAGHSYRRTAALLQRLLTTGESMLTTRFNIAELYVGVELARDPADEARRIESAMAGLGILDFDDAAARVYAAVQASLRRTGQPVGDFDALIASVAIRHTQKLVTRNPRHFDGIAGLEVVPCE